MISKSLVSTGAVLFTLGLLTACGAKIDYKSPDVKMPDMPDVNTMFKTCDKKDSEQPTVSSETLNSKIVVQDEIESKDLEYLDCDGKVTKTGHGPERYLNKFAVIDAPNDLPEAVSYVSIENFRTCAVHKFDAQDSDIGGTKIDLPDGKTMTTPMFSSASNRAGKIAVQLTDSTTKLNLYLNVHDGLNVLKVKYFGKCKKQKAEKFPFAKEDSYMNCEVDNEIESRDVVLAIQVQRPEVNGKKQINVCDKK